MWNEEQILSDCIKGRREAQKAFYLRFAPAMRVLCLRYSSNSNEAEDILQEGFLKVFDSLKQYSGAGSLEGWIKRIMINTTLTYCRKHFSKDLYNIADVKEVKILKDETEDDTDVSTNSAFEYARVEPDKVLEVLQALPEGYRTVFNLYAIEGYKHREIGELLGIEESTSKTQLMKARKMIQQKLKNIVTGHQEMSTKI